MSSPVGSDSTYSKMVQRSSAGPFSFGSCEISLELPPSEGLLHRTTGDRIAVAVSPKAVGSGGGAEGNRTPDLSSAIAALSHLSYGPTRTVQRGNSPPPMRWRVIAGCPPVLSSPCCSMHADCVRHLRAGPETPICRGQVGRSGYGPWRLHLLPARPDPSSFEDTHA